MVDIPRSCQASATRNAISALRSFIRTYVAWATTGRIPRDRHEPEAVRVVHVDRPPGRPFEVRLAKEPKADRLGRQTLEKRPDRPRPPHESDARELSFHRATQCPSRVRADTSRHSPETHSRPRTIGVRRDDIGGCYGFATNLDRIPPNAGSARPAACVATRPEASLRRRDHYEATSRKSAVAPGAHALASLGIARRAALAARRRRLVRSAGTANAIVSSTGRRATPLVTFRRRRPPPPVRWFARRVRRSRAPSLGGLDRAPPTMCV